jgi:putative ABC transport system permease protein
VKVHPENAETIATLIEATFKKVYPTAAFNYAWFDKELKESRSHSDDFSIVAFLSLMAITIACIGLLGIATYTSKMRQKEVGIRKIMGAEVKAIVFLLSKDFMKLLLIAGLVALPIAYILGSAFLQEFAYRISVDWKILGGSAIFIMLLGLLTISSQTLKVATDNPVKSLRNE